MNFCISMKFGSIITFLVLEILFLNPKILKAGSGNNENFLLVNTELLQGEKIFFTKHRVEHGIVLGDIYSMDPYGENVQQLTNFSKDFYVTERPVISSDGTKLGFISNFEEWKSSNYADAFILDFTTGKIERVTGFEKTTQSTATGTVNVTVSDPKGYAISPSAIRISYRGCSNYVTGNSATLTVPANEEIWVKAEVARLKGDVKVVTVPAGGNSSVELDLMNGTITAVDCSPSPNGDFMAVTRNSETISQQGEAFGTLKNLIWDTKMKEIVAEAGGKNLGSDKDPAYSPDGSMLAVCIGEPFANSLGILLTNNISDSPKILVEGKRILSKEFCSEPTWSPNSTEIVYVYTTLGAMGEIQSNLYKISINGGLPLKLTNFSGNEIVSRPSYSPDGTRIAFNRLKSNYTYTFTLDNLYLLQFTSDIFIVASNGGSTTSITNDGNAIDPSWGIINSVVDVEHEGSVPVSSNLYQNYPNPFNPITKIKFQVPENRRAGISDVKLIIYNISGQKVYTLLEGIKSPGIYEVEFDVTSIKQGITSGVYFYQLVIDGFIKTKKMIYLK